MTRRARLAVAVALVVVLAGAGVTLAAAGSGGGGSTACWPSLVPAYVAPGEVVALANGPRHPAMIIINPASGPGERAQDAYADAVRTAQRAGSRVIGYVATGYGRRSVADVVADARRYRAWYGVDGIFLDEASHHAADLEHYRAIASALRADGNDLVVLNPGVVPDRAYFALADVVVTFEGPFASYDAALRDAPAWLAAIPAGSIAWLVYDASPADAAAMARRRPHAGYVYVTAGVLPDPWGSMPGYAPDAAAPEGCP